MRPRHILLGCFAAVLGVTAIAAVRMLTAMSRTGVRIPSALPPVASVGFLIACTVAGPLGADGH